MRSALVVVTGLVAVLGCSKTAEPESSGAGTSAGSATATAMATPSASASGAGAAAPASADLIWTAAPAWQTGKNPSPMRKATYVVPKAAGDAEDGDLSISQAGGGTDANIKRWAAQFEGSPAPKVTTRMVGALKVTIVEEHGTFNAGGMPGMAAAGPKKDWALLAAIVEATDPPYFFKLTGPAKTIAASHDAFDTFVGSFHLAK